MRHWHASMAPFLIAAAAVAFLLAVLLQCVDLYTPQ